MEDTRVEVAEIGRVDGRILLLIAESHIQAPDLSVVCWGSVSPKALVVVEGSKVYAISLDGNPTKIDTLYEKVVGLHERVRALQIATKTV